MTRSSASLEGGERTWCASSQHASVRPGMPVARAALQVRAHSRFPPAIRQHAVVRASHFHALSVTSLPGCNPNRAMLAEHRAREGMKHLPSILHIIAKSYQFARGPIVATGQHVKALLAARKVSSSSRALDCLVKASAATPNPGSRRGASQQRRAAAGFQPLGRVHSRRACEVFFDPQSF